MGALVKQSTIKSALPLFDRRSALLYALLAATISADLVLFRMLDIRLTTQPSLWDLWPPALVVLGAAILRRRGWTRFSTALELVALATVQGYSAVVLQYPVAILAGPSPDLLLLRWDTALGFDWLSFARLFQEPGVIELLRQAYASIFWQPLILIPLLSWSGDLSRAWTMVSACLVASVISVAMLSVFPAQGAYVGCGLHAPDIRIVPHFCDFGFVIHQLRDLHVRIIEQSMMLGLVSMPSLHAAAGFIYVWATWPFKSLRLLSLFINALLWTSAITIGGHYFVDILAGLLLGAGAVVAVRQWPPLADRTKRLANLPS